MIGNLKATMELGKLNLPEQFSAYMEYCRALEFEEKPNYDYLRDLIRGVASDFDFSLDDNLYDWCIL